MARKTETKTVTKSITEDVEKTCDVCGGLMRLYRSEHETSIVIEERVQCFDELSENTYDICLSCWNNHVKPLFKTGPKTVEY